MLLFLLSFLSFILLSKSVSVKHLLPYASEMRLLSLWFFSKELLFLLVSWLMKRKLNFTLSDVSRAMSIKKRSVSSKVEYVEESDVMTLTVLDLPELALDNILGMLPPSGLCNMAGVCSSLRDKCRSDYLWEKHMKNKWGRVIGQTAYQEWQWQWQFASSKDFNLDGNMKKGLVKSLSLIWPLSWIRANLNNSNKPESFMPANTIMSWYLSLESGKFWFPAQVYNRENGHAGFLLSCYDAELCYDRHTDTFHARYPPHGRRTIVVEEGVQWDRLRAPPIDTPAHNLHASDCLNDLHPGDHIEIQWRRSKEFPYGWWYGTVGHLESCDGNKNYCHCHSSDTVALDFNQYALGSRWRRTVIDRKDHWEEGNEVDGFYGGIRKLYNAEEIAVWKRLWPTETLE